MIYSPSECVRYHPICSGRYAIIYTNFLMYCGFSTLLWTRTDFTALRIDSMNVLHVFSWLSLHLPNRYEPAGTDTDTSSTNTSFVCGESSTKYSSTAVEYRRRFQSKLNTYRPINQSLNQPSTLFFDATAAVVRHRWLTDACVFLRYLLLRNKYVDMDIDMEYIRYDTAVSIYRAFLKIDPVGVVSCERCGI